MKMPDEIKKGLECCGKSVISCDVCPYEGECHLPFGSDPESDGLAYIQQLESSRWELFDDLSTAYYGKVMYGLNDDGTVYSRYSCDTMSFEQAVDEFAHLLYKENE